MIKEESKRISISDSASEDFSIEANEINLVQRDIRNLVEPNRTLGRRINTTRNEDTVNFMGNSMIELNYPMKPDN